MSEKKIRELLRELEDELEKADARDELDEETREAARRLDRDVDRIIRSSEQKNSPFLEDAIALEAQFAARHPVAERIVRELVNTLARMGV